MPNLEISRGERLDTRVVSIIPLLSRSFATKLITDGKVTVNGKIANKGGQKLRPTDTVDVDFDMGQITIPEIELPVLFEDENCVVIIKPEGLLTHSKGAFNPEPSVATWLHNRIRADLAEQDKDTPNQRAGIVHRLDRATSGVMICAKTPEALAWLQKQFAQRRVRKTYNAVITGTLDPTSAVIDMPLERNPKAPATFRVGPQGKPAKTVYHVLEDAQEYSLIELKPETGRTHQLRVHLQELGHPIVGDTLYGGAQAERLYLHALELELTLPVSHIRQTFTAPLPPAFERLIRHAATD